MLSLNESRHCPAMPERGFAEGPLQAQLSARSLGFSFHFELGATAETLAI